MTVDFLISAPAIYSGSLNENFNYQYLREDLRDVIQGLSEHKATCVRLLPDFLVLRVSEPSADAARELRRIAASISLSMHGINKPTHEAPCYRFAMLTEFSVC